MVKVIAPAKINLCLDILSKLDDGYHSVWMVMQSISLFDTVSLEILENNEIIIECSDKKIPTDERNIVWKVAEKFFEKTGIDNVGIKIKIEKKIPSSAGLAGGSADGAATLAGMNRLFETNLSENELCSIGQTVGADIPFCIMGGTVLAQDIGQIMAKLPDLSNKKVVLVNPNREVSTKDAYEAFDSKSKIRHIDKSKILYHCARGEYEKSFPYFENVFEQLIEVPERVEIKAEMRQNNCLCTLMSGSGPSVYGVFDNDSRAEKCAAILKKKFENVFVCDCIKTGCKIVE